MTRRFVVMHLALILPSAALGGEPQRTDDTLLLCNFNSLDQADFVAGAAALKPQGATLVNGRWGKGLEVKPGQQLVIPSEGNFDATQGSFMFWFKPNWTNKTNVKSHALLSWGWADGKWAAPEMGNGYCVLSDGWWEPAGAGRTYLVFENQLYAHTSLALSYVKDEWMHFAFTWKFAKKTLGVCLYLNGERIGTASNHKAFDFIPKLRTPITLGCDEGTGSGAHRWADGVFDGLHILKRTLGEDEVRDIFRAQEPNWRQVVAKRNAWLHDVLKEPYTPKCDARGRVLESRALLDEGTGWATREGAAKTVGKLTRGGFNVYIPCIWHGRGATWPSKLSPPEKGVAKTIEAEAGFDPLKHLIDLCHDKGIEVHPWYCVCYRDQRWPHLNELTEEGTPKGAFEAHNPAFRKFIVDLMMEVVRGYDVDGLNLDYIRTKGISTTKTAQEAYRKQFGGELLEDMKKKEPNGWPNAKVVQFQNDVIADIVRAVAEQGRAAKPKLVISIDGHPAPPGNLPNIQGRDGFTWAQKGWIDVIYCMDYGRRLCWQKADALRAALDQPAAYVTIVGNYERTLKRKVVPREGRLVADLIGFCQRRSLGNGVALYLLSMLDDEQIEALRAGPFKEHAVPSWVRTR